MSKEEIRARFAANLKALREHMGYTQGVMAEALNVKRSSYSGYENGSSEPSLIVLYELQKRFDIGADVFLSSSLERLSRLEWSKLKGLAMVRMVERHAVLLP